MAGLNKVLIIGRLGRDPELRYSQDGRAIANFSVATSEEWKDQGGQKQSRTEWHKLVVFGRLAEVCGQFLHKGSQAYFEGRLQTREWEKDGVKLYSTEIVVANMQMLDGKGKVDGDQGAGVGASTDDGDIPF